MSTAPKNPQKVGPNRRFLRAHLQAKLFRLASVSNDGFEASNLVDFQLIPKVNLTSYKSEDPSDTRTYNKITMFSGAFIKGMDFTTLPFIVSFSYRAGEPRAAIGQFAIGCRLAANERTLAFLSVIDYLERSGDLPAGSLQKHKVRLTQSGQRPERAATVDGYEEFCERALRDVPYDDMIAAAA